MDSLGNDTMIAGERSEKEVDAHTTPTREVRLLGEGSPGVRRIEIIASHFRLVDKVFLFLSIFLVAYVYGLDGTVRNTYQASHQTSVLCDLVVVD